MKRDVKSQSENVKMQSLRESAPGYSPVMGKPIGISDRLLDFAADVIKLTYVFPKTAAGKHIGTQLVRSATSIGANYEEGNEIQLILAKSIVTSKGIQA